MNIIYTNNRLYKTNIVSNEMCTFCDAIKETVRHILWECRYPERFWELVSEKIKEDLNVHVALEYSKVFVNNVVQEVHSAANLHTMVGKQYLYRCRCL